MAFNAFVSIDEVKVSRLPFVKGAYAYYFIGSGGEVLRGIVYELTKEDFGKAYKRLYGQSTEEIKSGDSVYIMPGSKIPLFKLKDHCRKIGATVTGDMHKATFFIGTSRIVEKSQFEREWQPRSSTLLFSNEETLIADIHDPRAYSTFAEKVSLEGITDTSSFVDLLDHEKYTKKVVLSKKFLRKHLTLLVDEQGKMYFLTPAAINILYNSISKKIPIVSEETILSQISPAVIIDDYTHDSVESMLASSDDESNELGAEILANCNIERSMFYLWKLATKHGSIVSSVHSKNMRLFMERTQWYKLMGLNAEEFIQHLKQKKLLTKEYFQALIAEASKEYEKTLETSVFKMVLTPSDEYKEYAEPNNVFKFVGKEVEEDEEETEEGVEEDSVF